MPTVAGFKVRNFEKKDQQEVYDKWKPNLFGTNFQIS